MKRLLGFKKAPFTESEKYCRSLVYRYDRENFIGANFLKAEHRRAVIALRAYNITIANSTAAVSDEAIAKAKLAFWVEQVRAKSGQHGNTPVAEELAWLKEEKGVPKLWLKRLVDARMNRLEYGRHLRPFRTMADLEKYSDDTHGVLLQCALHTMGVKDILIDKASQNIARAIGLTQQLRATPYYTAHRHVTLPLDLVKGHNVRLRTMMASPENPSPATTPEITELVFDVSSRAVGYITKTRTQYKLKDDNARRLFCASVTPSDVWLKRLEKDAQFDIFNESLQTVQHDVASTMALQYHWHKKF